MSIPKEKRFSCYFGTYMRRFGNCSYTELNTVLKELFSVLVHGAILTIGLISIKLFLSGLKVYVN